MNDEEIRQKLDSRSQYRNRTNALAKWEATASKKDRKLFESYVRNWLLMRADGASIGWKAFAELCKDEIPGFDINCQTLQGALSGRIKRL